METYLEILVPFSKNAKWFLNLRAVLRQSNIPVRWQNEEKYPYHITMAYLDYTPEGVRLETILDKHFAEWPVPELIFDRIDVFETKKRGDLIINLTSSPANIPDGFKAKIASVRKDLEESGCRIESDFKLHVTLGRIKAEQKIECSTVSNLIAGVKIPSFSLVLTDVEHRKARTEHSVPPLYNITLKELR